jgi:hypothetical protein
VTFWNLELYDISLPANLYATLKARVEGLSPEIAAISDEGERQRLQLRVREQTLTLDKERETQRSCVEATRARLARESASWICRSIDQGSN